MSEYIKQTWVDGETPVDAEHLNHLEEGVAAAHKAIAELPEIPEIPDAPVQSVNGKTGDVALTASDVGALPADAEIIDTTARAGVAALTEEIEEIRTGGEITWSEVGETVVGRFDETTGKLKEGNWAAYNTAIVEVEAGSQYRVTTYAHKFIAAFTDKNGNVISTIPVSAETAESTDGTYYRYTDKEIEIPANAHTLWVSSAIKYYSSHTEPPFTRPIIQKGKATGIVYLTAMVDHLENEQKKTEAHFPLEGKTVVNFGDSIFGWFDAPDDISTKIAELTGATVYNVGFGAMWMSGKSGEAYNFCMCGLAESVAAQDFSAQVSALETWSDASAAAAFAPTVETLQSIDFSEVDAITIAYGTNDFTANIPLDHETNPTNKWSFASALRYSIETILTAHPHIKIYVCTPIYRFYLDESGAYSNDSDTATNTNGVTLVEFAEKAIEVAKEYHLPYIDNYNELGINKFTRLEYFDATDGTHPNLAGRHLIARHIAHKLW